MDQGLGRGSGMLAKLRTFSLLGIEAMPVEVEVDVSPRAMPKTYWSDFRKPQYERVRIAANGQSLIQDSSGLPIVL